MAEHGSGNANGNIPSGMGGSVIENDIFADLYCILTESPGLVLI